MYISSVNTWASGDSPLAQLVKELDLCLLCPPQWGVDILFLLFPLSSVQTLGFRSFEGKVFILSLPNLEWLFIGLISCMGMLLVNIGL